MTTPLQDEVMIYKDCNLGVIKLNRPEALNALSLEMIRQISHYLSLWEAMDSISCIYITGEGERAFCAGGDLKAFYRAGMQYRRGETASNLAHVYFQEEYALNSKIFHYSKPIISYMNGITMGGGYGLAGNASHRVVCEATRFAMPEAGIGFFPDVGSLYHLSRCENNFGAYLALSGAIIECGDMLCFGLADYFVPQTDEEAFMDTLKAVVGLYDIENVLGRFCNDSSPSSKTQAYHALIKDVFEGHDVPKYLERLEVLEEEWAQDLLKRLLRQSPTSLCVIAKYLKWAGAKDFDDIIDMDLNLARNFVQHRDLYEGIRAVIIEKDSSPAWFPETISDVKKTDIDRFFES